MSYLKSILTQDVHLPELSKLNSDRFFGYSTKTKYKEKLESGKIQIDIVNENNINSKPLKEQLNTVEWIKKNEGKIMQSLFNEINHKIYPYYKNGEDWEDEISYPKIDAKKDLEKVIGITGIGIWYLHKNDMAYYLLCFDFSADSHGLIVIMHNEKVIGFTRNCDFEEKEIVEDLGINYDEWLIGRRTKR